jgi:quinol monooxygenase YgiN
MYTVITRVGVDPDAIDELAQLFEATNRDLVGEYDDWLGAWFTANRERNEITVIARWRDARSYARLRSSAEFQATMAKFAQRFTTRPDVSVNEVLVEM